MKRPILIFLLGLFALPATAQTVLPRRSAIWKPEQYRVRQDAQGHLVTTFVMQNPGGITDEVQFLGSPFFQYPVWQPGTLIFTNQQQLPVRLAYNIMAERISCQLADSTEIPSAEPEQFRVGSLRFVRVPIPLGRVFCQVLNEGKIRLLKHYQSHLFSRVIQGGAYRGNSEFQGEYKTTVDYYLQGLSGQPQPVSLTRKSLLKALGSQQNRVSLAGTHNQLTESEVVEALTYYKDAPQP